MAAGKREVGMRVSVNVLLGALIALMLAGTVGVASAETALERRERELREAQEAEAEAEAERQRAEQAEGAVRSDVESALARKAELEAARDEAQGRLDELQQQFMDAAVAFSEAEARLVTTMRELEAVEESVAALEGAIADRESQVASLVRNLYMHGGPMASYEAVLKTEAISDTARRLGYIESAQRHQRGIIEGYLADRDVLDAEERKLAAARVEQESAAAALEERRGELAARVAEQESEVAELRSFLDGAAAELAQLETVLAAATDRTAAARGAEAAAAAEIAEARSAVDQERRRIAAEQAERERQARLAAERAAKAAEEQRAATRQTAQVDRSSSSSSSSSSSTSSSSSSSTSSTSSSSGSIACPVGTPRSYSDTWGAPRSGGRTHQGTDILAPMGTSINAYESGTISRMSNNRLGGITLYLRGDSGNVYYYAHLRGYVSGLRVGQRVSVGQQVGYNGDSGNAAGIPHLHIEVQLPNGSKTNPYPYMYRACG